MTLYLDVHREGEDCVSVYGRHAMHPHQERYLYGEAG